jgi:hypothetical protein
MADEKLIPNIDYLGTAYDVVEMDPLNLGDTSKNQNIFALSVEDGWASPTPDGIYLVPNGVRHHAPFSMGYESASTAMSSSYEFQQEVKLQVDVDAGVEGAFEFSASASNREVEKVAESRNRTFSYYRAYQDDHILDLDLDNENAPLALRSEFQDAVLALPYQDEVLDWQQKYEDFIGTWGTHFTKGIVLGGLAYQRVSGKASTLLRSTESEQELKAGASAEFEAFKGGAKLDDATKQAESKASEYSLELDKLEFRGGDGGTHEIASTWFQSCVDRPAITKASLERLSYLLTPRFFPDQPCLGDLQMLLDRAIDDWILNAPARDQGGPTSDTAPLRYGEPFVLMMPWRDGKTEQIAVLHDGSNWPIQFPINNPANPEPDYTSPIAAFRISSNDGSNKGGVILAGDQIRIEVIDKGWVNRDVGVTTNSADAGRFTVLHYDDNPNAPERIGEYFQSSDDIRILLAGSTDQALGLPASRELNSTIISNAVNFRLIRCAEREEE